MKKLPVLLLILTLAVTPVQEIYALETDMGTDALEAEVDTAEATEQRTTTEWPVLNDFDARFHIQVIKPREGVIEVEMDSPIGQEIQIQRAWVASMDYENGWTEAEVDALLEDWTELEAEWAKVAKEQVLSNMGLHSYATIPLTIGNSRLQYDLTEVNLSDILYYAAEFKDLANEGAEPIWVRGKVDYRGCVHASGFQNWGTGTCMEVVDREQGTVKYLPSIGWDLFEEEEVATWEEEWRSTLAGRLDDIGVVLDGLAMIPEMSEEALDWSLTQEEGKLTVIEELLAKAAGVEAEIMEAAILRERIAGMRKIGDNDNEGSGGADFEGDTGDGFEGDSGNGTGAGSDMEVDAGGSDDTDGDLIGDSGFAGSDSIDGVGNGVSGGETFIEEISGVKDASGEGMADNNTEKAEVDDRDDREEAIEVEVPKLGEVRAERGWLWWVVAAAGVLSLALVAILKRRSSEKE